MCLEIHNSKILTCCVSSHLYGYMSKAYEWIMEAFILLNNNWASLCVFNVYWMSNVLVSNGWIVFVYAQSKVSNAIL